MARNRTIYQSAAVYAGPDKTAKGDAGWVAETGTSNSPNQLKRIQSANYSFDIARTDVNQFGELAAIDRVILESPTVSFDTSWYLCNFYNEDKVGLKVNQTGVAEDDLVSVLTDILVNNADERNYYVRVVSEGSDAVTFADGANNNVIGIGNGFLASYSAEGAVGGFPTANITIEGLNMAFTTKESGWAPWIKASDGTTNAALGIAGGTVDGKAFDLPTATSSGASTSDVTAIKPGNITLTLPSSQGGADLSGIAVQSFNASFDLAREPLNKLGSRFAFTREITFPVTASMSCDALVGDLTTGDLADMLTRNPDQKVIVRLDDDTDAAEHMAIVMKSAKLDSQNFSMGIGDNQTVTLNWSTQVGSAAQSGIGIFLSGYHN